MITVYRQVKLEKGRRKHKQRHDLPDTQVGRVPRVSRLMALAIRLDEFIRDGVFGCQTAIAALGHVSRARMTQIMNLLSLAPDIQEQLLFLSVTKRERDAITERHLRRIAAKPIGEVSGNRGGDMGRCCNRSKKGARMEDLRTSERQVAATHHTRYLGG